MCGTQVHVLDAFVNVMSNGRRKIAGLMNHWEWAATVYNSLTASVIGYLQTVNSDMRYLGIF